MKSLMSSFEQLLRTRIPDFDALPDADPNVCKRCGGSEVLFTSDDRAYACPDCRRKYIEEGLNHAMRNWEGWPPPNMRSLAGWMATPTRERARAFFNTADFTGGTPRALVFTGKHGRGKTAFSLAILRGYALAGVFCTALCFPELIGKIKRMDIDLEKLWHRIGRSGFILCDEVGREPKFGNADHARDFISRLIQECYLKKTLIITTNLTGRRDLGGYLDSYMASRLADPRWLFAVVKDEGPDLRRGKKDG